MEGSLFAAPMVACAPCMSATPTCYRQRISCACKANLSSSTSVLRHRGEVSTSDERDTSQRDLTSLAKNGFFFLPRLSYCSTTMAQPARLAAWRTLVGVPEKHRLQFGWRNSQSVYLGCGRVKLMSATADSTRWECVRCAFFLVVMPVRRDEALPRGQAVLPSIRSSAQSPVSMICVGVAAAAAER